MFVCRWLGLLAALCVSTSALAGQVRILYVPDTALDQPQVGVYLRDSVDYLPHDSGGYVMPGLLDTGAAAHVLPKYLSDLEETPLDPLGQADVLTLCGDDEYMDVSQPLTIGVGPYDSETEADFSEFGPQRLVVRIEDPAGSELLGFPVVIGTPYMMDHAAYIDYQLVEIWPGLSLPELVTTPRPASQPAPGPIDLTVPLTTAGETNLDNSLHTPTAWSVPFVNVVLCHGTNRRQRSFIMDTGSQITFVSTALAEELGLDLANPVTSQDVVGAGTCTLTINGYYLDKLIIPTDQHVALVFENSTVWVLDVPGIDGGIGSNTLFDFDEQQAVDINLASGVLGFKLNVPIPAPGDFNDDGTVNIADLQAIVASWNTTFGQPGHNDAADANCDGYVNVGDLQLLVASWGQTTRILGDINLDGTVNIADLQALVAAWDSSIAASSTNWDPNADCNKDGYVNVGDLQILIANWGRSMP